MNRTRITLTTAVFLLTTIQTSFAQTKSAIQFYDSTGVTKTGKVGWSGDAANGHLFLQTPTGGEVLKATSAGVEVTGAMNATRFSGDGSGLTNLPSSAMTVGSVTGLSDSLHRKADTSWVTTKIAGIGTAQIPDGAVTTGKIADTAVTAAKIRDKAVTDTKIDSVSWVKVKNKPARYRTHSDSITWTAGTDGQVWKMGANGTPTWGADLQGAGGATTISGITGLSDSLTAHRTLINAKADASHTQAISTVNGLSDSLTAHRTLINGKANTSHGHAITDVSGLQTAIDGKAASSHTQAISTVTGLTDSITAHRNLINGKANSADVYTKSELHGIIGGDDAYYMRDASSALQISSSSPYSFQSITITAPSDGFVILWANAVICPWSDGTSNWCALYGSVSSDPSSIDSYQHSFVWGPTEGYHVNFAMTRMIPVTAGNNTFHLKFWKPNDGNPYKNGQINHITMTGVFVKSRL